jgi:cytochrome d ubiquinol oxidase subunit I
MAVSAGAFGLLAIVALWAVRKKSKIDISKYKWVLWIFGLSTFLPYVAITSGWLITELGRAPWVVYGVLTMADAVSPNVSATSLLTSNILYFTTFLVLGLIMILLSRRVMIAGPESVDEEVTDENVDPFSPEAFTDGKEA